MNSNQVEKELLPFLLHDTRFDLKVITLQNVLGLTGSEEGRNLLSQCPKLIAAVVQLSEHEHKEIVKEAVKTLTNLATHFDVALLLVTEHLSCLLQLLRLILKPAACAADAACMALCNVTRTQRCCLPLAAAVREASDLGLARLLQVLCHEKYNTAGCSLKYLGPLICNLSQDEALRNELLSEENLTLLQRLLPYTEYSKCLLKRAGIVGTLKNCCFETNRHMWLLGERVDLLPRLLLPLAGPEEFSEEDTEKLPPDLQYLEPNKLREPDGDVRIMLLEAIYLLCATSAGRTYVRSKNAYIILRALDRCEKEQDVKSSLRKLIALLISEEPDKKFENLRDVQIPESLWEKFSREVNEEPLYEIPEGTEGESKGFWVK